MKMNTIVVSTALAGILLAASPEAARADAHTTLKDPSFELQLPPAEGGWVLFETSSYSSDKARSGSRSIAR